VKLLALLHWELVQTTRGLAPHVAITFAAFISTALAALGVASLSRWSPLTSTDTASNFFRVTRPPSSHLASLAGEYRGAITYLIIVCWMLLIAAFIGPAFSAGTVVRDRQSGRLARLLTDAARADVVTLVKLLTALIPLSLVLVAILPTASFAWLLGGLLGREAVFAALILVVVIVLVVAIGLLCSALATTEASALLVSYLAVGSFLFGPLVVGLGLSAIGLSGTASIVLSFAPLVAVLSAESSLAKGYSQSMVGEWPVPRMSWEIGKLTVPAWTADAVVYLILAIILVWLTSVVIEPLHPFKTRLLRQSQLCQPAVPEFAEEPVEQL